MYGSTHAGLISLALAKVLREITSAVTVEALLEESDVDISYELLDVVLLAHVG